MPLRHTHRKTAGTAAGDPSPVKPEMGDPSADYVTVLTEQADQWPFVVYLIDPARLRRECHADDLSDDDATTLFIRLNGAYVELLKQRRGTDTLLARFVDSLRDDPIEGVSATNARRFVKCALSLPNESRARCVVENVWSYAGRRAIPVARDGRIKRVPVDMPADARSPLELMTLAPLDRLRWCIGVVSADCHIIEEGDCGPHKFNPQACLWFSYLRPDGCQGERIIPFVYEGNGGLAAAEVALRECRDDVCYLMVKDTYPVVRNDLRAAWQNQRPGSPDPNPVERWLGNPTAERRRQAEWFVAEATPSKETPKVERLPTWERLEIPEDNLHGNTIVRLDGIEYRTSSDAAVNLLRVLKAGQGRPMLAKMIRTTIGARADHALHMLHHEKLRSIVEQPGKGKRGYRLKP